MAGVQGKQTHKNRYLSFFFCDVIEAAVELCCKLTPKITFAGGSSNFKLYYLTISRAAIKETPLVRALVEASL